MTHGSVIVGASHAGQSAAAQLRTLAYRGPIKLVGAEPHEPYQRPPLSKKYLSGSVGVDRLSLRARQFYRSNNIELLTGAAVEAVDPAQRRVTLVDGSHLNYDTLVLATGARPKRLPA